ncbi:MAG: deoxyribose-phosphate aldolase [Bacteroidales bacterium]|nr:deoxyribose-phosphate aldolase [Bacteroidales bacterium]
MKFFSDVNMEVDEKEVHDRLESLSVHSISETDREPLKKVFSFIDLTSLGEQDNAENVGQMCHKVNLLGEAYPSLPNVAAICVFPELVPVVAEHLENPLVTIASVAGGFPSSQTFTEIKIREVRLVLELGAEEVDIVLPVGKFLLGDYDLIKEEIKSIKNVMGSKILKVILETGSLNDLGLIRKASFLAMGSGADFIKTSTGKIPVGATPEAMMVMCQAIKDYYNKTGKKIGIKPAGGISEPLTALNYYRIVEHVLGEEWLSAERFRIGASRLANRIMAFILGKDENFIYF